MKKIIIYNPYNLFNLHTLFFYPKILKDTFGKAELIKKIISEKNYFYFRIKYIEKKVAKYRKNNTPLFNHIEIETINRCNNVCEFCPVNVKRDIRPFKTMKKELFKKIINQLSDINYSGEIAFHSNNEPLLDNDLKNKIAYARKKCPNAFLYFYTNGILINTEKIIEFKKSGINKIVINNYCNNKKLAENIKKIIEELKKLQDSEYPQIIIIIRKLNQILNNRGGHAPNKPITKFFHYKLLENTPCIYPFKRFVIRPDGKVSLCSHDAYGEITMGDINNNSLIEIWYGKQFKKIRKQLLTNGRKGLHLCDKCDG